MSSANTSGGSTTSRSNGPSSDPPPLPGAGKVIELPVARDAPPDRPPARAADPCADRRTLTRANGRSPCSMPSARGSCASACRLLDRDPHAGGRGAVRAVRRDAGDGERDRLPLRDGLLTYLANTLWSFSSTVGTRNAVRFLAVTLAGFVETMLLARAAEALEGSRTEHRRDRAAGSADHVRAAPAVDLPVSDPSPPAAPDMIGHSINRFNVVIFM